MNKVISLKGLRLRRRRISARPKRNIDINPRDRNINIFKIAVSLAAVISVLLGSLFFAKMSASGLEQYFTNFIKALQAESFKDVFKELCSIEVIFISVCFILGTFRLYR